MRQFPLLHVSFMFMAVQPNPMHKLCSFLLLYFISLVPGNAQEYLLKGDSLASLLKSKYVSLSPRRIDLGMEMMNRHLPNSAVFDSIKNILIAEVEASRDRVMMCDLYNKISASYLGYNQKSEFFESGKMYADKCMQIATESGLNEYRVAAMMRYARYYLNLSQNQKALDFNNQAISLASSIGSDSLLSLAYASIAVTWDNMANKLSQFQALLSKREFAERSKIHRLITDSYQSLGDFYEEIGEYEKAKDLYTLCIGEATKWKDYAAVFASLRAMAKTYISQKNDRLGLSYYDKALHYADSLGQENMKLEIYLDQLNYYFNNSDPVKGFTYLNAHPQLMEFIRQYGVEYQVNKLYAALEGSRGHYDSALRYLHVAEPDELGQKNNFREKFEFSMQMADVLKNLGRLNEQKASLLRARNYADSSQNLYDLRDVSLELDSVYLALGDYKNAQIHLSAYNTYRDSAETLSKQKDLLSIEIQNANKRAEQQKLEQQEATRNRNNLEYMGITAALATVFIILVIFGVFKISPAVIKALGFFAFIFLFEFIVLLLDTQIHEITGGEPWKVLGVKIIIIAMLLPLHHWLEEKMLHYLTSRAHTIPSKFFSHKNAET
jgi:tetratricopeptide (TPR) repeat protein